MQKSILITGCSSGIGYTCAVGLKARGWRVFAACRTPEDCARLRSEGFDSPLIDYDRPDTLHEGLAEVLATTGGTLDALFNNGAYAIPGAVEDIPADAMRAIFQSNVFGWHELTNAVLPVMRAQGQGRVVQCSSVLGFVGAPWRGAYNATKFALEGLTDTLRIEMRDTDIDIILIEPGPIRSEFRANSARQFERWIDWTSSARSAQYETSLIKRLYQATTSSDRFERPPEAVLDKLIHAIESPRPHPRYFVTTPTYIMNLLRRILPTKMLDWVLARG
jgi:NAD(P)-dependent dehydrogenase (short-subunit alcohol dehydrogenase family)